MDHTSLPWLILVRAVELSQGLLAVALVEVGLTQEKEGGKGKWKEDDEYNEKENEKKMLKKKIVERIKRKDKKKKKKLKERA